MPPWATSWLGRGDLLVEVGGELGRDHLADLVAVGSHLPGVVEHVGAVAPQPLDELVAEAHHVLTLVGVGDAARGRRRPTGRQQPGQHACRGHRDQRQDGGGDRPPAAARWRDLCTVVRIEPGVGPGRVEHRGHGVASLNELCRPPSRGLQGSTTPCLRGHAAAHQRLEVEPLPGVPRQGAGRACASPEEVLDLVATPADPPALRVVGDVGPTPPGRGSGAGMFCAPRALVSPGPAVQPAPSFIGMLLPSSGERRSVPS